MQESTEAFVNGKVQLKPYTSEYEVEGFSDRHEAHNHDRGTWLLIKCLALPVAVAVTLVGVLTLLFGPSTVTYSWSGPTFLQFIQLYPGPITSVGMLLLGCVSQINATKLGPEAFLLKTYELIPPDGFDVSAIDFQYLGSNKFLIAIDGLPQADTCDAKEQTACDV